MVGLLLCVLYLAVSLGGGDIDIIRPPPRDLSSDCKVANTMLKPEPWREWDNITYVIEGLLTGNKTSLAKISGTFFDKFRIYHPFCDFLTSYEPPTEDWEYVPAACVKIEECANPAPFVLTEWGNKTCRQAAKASGRYADDEIGWFTCCPVNGTRQWQHLIGGSVFNGIVLTPVATQRHEEFKEPPSVFDLEPNSTYVYVSGRNVDYLGNTEKALLQEFFDNENYKAFENAQVCGFTRGEFLGIKPQANGKGTRRVYTWYPYFCVKPSQCGKAKEKGTPLPEANPLWHQFCQPRFTPEDNPRIDVSGEPRYIFPIDENNENTHCCHVNDVGELFLKADKGSYVPSPQLPTYLRWAPGLRSVYKCEQYAKKICDRASEGGNNCVEGFFYPPNEGQDPHMASLGVIVPNIMVFHCGGALVSLRYIMSAAVCRKYAGYEVNVVMLGEHATSSYEYGKERFYVITEIVQIFGSPPAFRPKPWQDHFVRTESDSIDLALYKTEVEVEFTRFIRPICLWHGHRSWSQNPHFLGWGSRELYRSEYLDTLTMLKETKLCASDAFNHDTVENPYYGRYGSNQNWMVCYKNGHNTRHHKPPEGHSNPCNEDLGGPLQETLESPYCTKLLLGILSSRNTNTNRLKPSVFINISNFLGAIEDEVWGSKMFIDLVYTQHETPKCGHPKREDFFFFNKCEGGEDC